MANISRTVQDTLAMTEGLSVSLKPGDQSRGWRRRWLEVQRELEGLVAPSAEPLSGDTIQAARHRLHSFCVQTYHLKDALKEEAAATGMTGDRIEAAISSDPALALMADLANLDKHGRLDRPPRSGHVPTITSVEGQSLDSPSGGWRLRLSVEHGGTTMDGLEIAQAAADAWRRGLAAWGLI